MTTSPTALPLPERVLCELLHRHWVLTVEGPPPRQEFVAYRPIGWTGEGDPHERISAPTREELLYALAHRHLAVPGHEEEVPLPRRTRSAPLAPEEEGADRRVAEHGAWQDAAPSDLGPPPLARGDGDRSTA